MKATDLMIGDWVLLDNSPNKVVEIYKYSVLLQGRNFNTNEIDIQPIPLTPEILEKNGFERKTDDEGQELYSLLLGEWAITFMSVCGCPYLTIEDVLDYDRGHSVLNLKDTVYNVHELQHALRLCAIEKEITL